MDLKIQMGDAPHGVIVLQLRLRLSRSFIQPTQISNRPCPNSWPTAHPLSVVTLLIDAQRELDFGDATRRSSLVWESNDITLAGPEWR